MTSNHFTFPLKRTTCFSYYLRRHHRLFRLLIPISFIMICVVLFFKIQHFVDDLTHRSSPRFRTVNGNVKVWNEGMHSGTGGQNLVRNGALHLDVFDKSLLITRRNHLDSNDSVEMPEYRRFSQNYSDYLPKAPLHHQVQQNEDIISSTSNTNPILRGQQLIRSATEVNPRPRADQNDPARGKGKALSKPEERVPPVIAVIVVVSRPNNVLLRLAARRTWAEYTDMYRIVVRFVVGRLEDWSDIVDRESTMHKDIIVFEQNDTADSLPSKVIDGFDWALRQNPAPLFVMKIDDDTIVNLPYLVKELSRSKPVFTSSQILGTVRRNVKVVRDPNDQWGVSMLDFPSATYPPYAFGGGYLMYLETARVLLKERYFSPTWVHLEDVYLTGFVAARAGIGLKNHNGFSSLDSEKPTACDFVQQRMITSVNNTEREFYDFYKQIQTVLRASNRRTCL